MSAAIYTLIDEGRLRDVLGTLYAFTELQIQLIDESGAMLMAFGQPNRYCALLKKHVFLKDECFQQHLKAGEQAQALGEAYVFACHANLNHIAFPLQDHGMLLGSIIIGPFLMDVPDSTLVSGVAESYHLSPTLSLDLFDELGGLQVIAPVRVTQLSCLVDHLLSPLLPSERPRLIENQEKLYQQSRINETIQRYKTQDVLPSQSFLYQKERELIAKVKAGDVPTAKALLNELLGYVFFSEGGQIEAVRTHALELTTLLSRVAMEGGAHAETVFSLNGQYLSVMERDQSIDSLCHVLQEVVESFVSAMFGGEGQSNLYIRKALGYMSTHYARPLSVREVADHVGLSPNYFSSVFVRVMGVTFREQLSRIRVEESKRLLLSTQYSLTDIAVAMGFADQSCFCKTFKRLTGVSPSRFR